MANDGGIDGYGYHVDADDFRTTRVVIQCKRFNSNPVSEPDINQFLGAMNKYQADYGVFITNSRFTNKAREAAREGTPITLIDGNDLIRLVIKYELYMVSIPRIDTNDSIIYSKDFRKGHRMMAKQKTYIAIDLKSFYASVECKERNRDPLTTNLVVADKSRTEKTICLAVSPSLKNYGIKH